MLKLIFDCAETNFTVLKLILLYWKLISFLQMDPEGGADPKEIYWKPVYKFA